MNNKICLLFISLLFLCSSCRKALDITPMHTSSETATACATVSCPEIDINYVFIAGASETANKVNTSIKHYIIESLYIGEKEEIENGITTIEEAINAFIEMYRTHSAEFPDLSAEYFAEVTTMVTYNSKHVLSLQCNNYLYTGGAHGNGATTYLNFDPKTGDLLTYEDIFSNVAVLDAKAETLFRKEHAIEANESINATGFWFENDTFYLPETIGISKEFITLQYDTYEIAAYAAGPIEIEIPISEVKSLLKIPIE